MSDPASTPQPSATPVPAAATPAAPKPEISAAPPTQAAPAPTTVTVATATTIAKDHPELNGYKLIQELGKSPRGTVYKARRQTEQDIVAVKIIRASTCDKTFLEKLPQRAEATFMLEHDNLVKCLGCNNVSGRTVLVMGFAPGQPVSRTLKKNGRFQPSQALIVALQCVTALRHAAQHNCHHGRLHPADIILGEDHARITGVGLGERAEHPPWDEGRAPHLFEPLIYTAPEAMPSKPPLEKSEAKCAADIYSLGAILFHMLTGMPPFHSSDETGLNAERERLNMSVAWPRQMAVQLPSEVINLTEKMLSFNPANRPAYEQLVPALTVSIPIAEQIEEPKRKASALPANLGAAAVAARAPSVGGSGTPHKVVVIPASDPQAQAAARPGTAVSVLDFPTARGGATSERQTLKGAKAERFFTTVLVGVTVIVFLFAASLAVERFIYEPSRAQTVAQLNPAPTPVAPVAPVANPMPPALPTPAPTPPAATVTEPKTAHGPTTDETSHTQASANANVNANATGTDDYAAATRQVDLIREMMKSGQVAPSAALLRLVRGLVNKAGHDTPAGINALVLATEIEDAMVHKYYAQNQNTNLPLTNPGAAPQPNVPPAGPEKPQTVAEKTTPQEKPSAPATAAPAAEKHTHDYDAGIQAAFGKVRKYQYTQAKQDLEDLAAKADGDGKKVVQAAQELVKLEADLFEKCRGHLKTYIDKDPQHASMLQVFPRKNDPKGDDIVDIDDKGLKIVSKRGGSETSRVREWEKVSSTNGFKMFQLLSDKKSADEQVGLATFAAFRGMKDEFTSTLDGVRGLANGKDKVDSLNQDLELLGKLVEPGN